MQAFLRRFFAKLNGGASSAGVGSGGLAGALQTALAAAVAPLPAKPSVNIQKALDAASLAKLDPSAWPASSNVDQLRDEIDTLKKRGVTSPFIYVDLGAFSFLALVLCFYDSLQGKRSLPQWAGPLIKLVEEGEESPSA